MSKNSERQIVLKDNDSEYGTVIKILGNCRFLVSLNLSNKEVIGRLRGKFRHKKQKKANTVCLNSVVLVGIRDFTDKTTDIIYVYNDSEVQHLKKHTDFIECAVKTSENRKNEHDDFNQPFDFEEI